LDIPELERSDPSGTCCRMACYASTKPPCDTSQRSGTSREPRIQASERSYLDRARVEASASWLNRLLPCDAFASSWCQRSTLQKRSISWCLSSFPKIRCDFWLATASLSRSRHIRSSGRVTGGSSAGSGRPRTAWSARSSSPPPHPRLARVSGVS